MRALLIALECLGVGQLTDHPVPNTLAELLANVPELELPTLFALGLGEILKGRVFDPPARKCIASYGRMIQRSAGADLLSSLWELAGVILPCPFIPSNQLPTNAVDTLCRECGSKFLFNPQETLTPEILAAHRETGQPILSPGPGSTLRLWASEAALPGHRLSRLCRKVRRCANGWHIAKIEGRRPEVPNSPLITLPALPPRTLLNAIADRGLAVEAIGNLHENFAHSGITRSHPATTAAACLQTLEHLWHTPQNGLLATHLAPLAAPEPRQQAAALREIDAWLCGFLENIDSESLVILTGTNCAEALGPGAPRQEVPVLLLYGGRTQPLGIRETLADVAATLAAFFGIKEPGSPWNGGTPLITFQRPKGFNGPWGS